MPVTVLPAPAGGVLPPGWMPPEPPRRRLWVRLVLGASAIVLLTVIATLVFVSGEIKTLKKATSQNPSLQVKPGILGTPDASAQTLLLVGDDQRSITKFYRNAVLPHSNEMLLVRIDPSKPAISMMSIPRDLEVAIYPPGEPAVTTRFNYAYTAGGVPLLLSTIKRVLGLTVNHVAVVTFGRFKRAVDQMGCVYSTIDRRYYHSNVGDVPQYQEINLEPGYQRLCGPEALEFVSYRHGDTALIRDARNQSFLLDVKKEFGPTLFENANKFEKIFGAAVQTDPSLHTTSGILDLLATLVASAGRPVRQVQFQANLLSTEVTASSEQIRASVESFLNGGVLHNPKQAAAVAKAVRHKKSFVSLGLVPSTPAELAAARAVAAGLPFPLEYPHVRDQLADALPDDLRAYQIHDLQGHLHPAYVAVISQGLLGQYYDIQGTTWTGAPIFNDPDQTVHVAGREYSLYYVGENLNMVAWREHGAAYWVRNTLTNEVSPARMLAIAEKTSSVATTADAGPAIAEAGLGAFGVPKQTGRQASVDPVVSFGAIASLLALLGIAFLSVRLVGRRAELISLRQQLGPALALDAYNRASAASAGIPPKLAARPAASGGRRAQRGPRTALDRPLVLVGAIAAVILVGASAYGAAAGWFGAAHKAHPPPPPTTSTRLIARVAVLNASGRAGAARTLAAQLEARGVTVGTVGNTAAPPGGAAAIEILYAPGEEQQASLVGRLLSDPVTTRAPLNPATAAAAGQSAQVVVVIGGQ